MAQVRILFVDDERSVLDGLRRMLRRHASQWDMKFVTSAAEALEQLATGSFDVLVTDMQMPGMSGAELLEEVVRRWPDIGRIILSGHADEAMGVRAARVAHQYLAKPADPETLKAAVARAISGGGGSGNEHVRALVGGCHRLPGLPTLCAELAGVLESRDGNARSVAAVISKDPGMSAKILQLVNSSFFGIGRRVSSVELAVTLLGMVRVRALVVREQIFEAFVLPRPVRYFSVEGLGHRSLRVAELARLISKAEGQGDDRPDQAFTAGLLHDVGLLVLACVEEKFSQVMREVHENGVPIIQAEREILQLTHTEIGASLLGLWGLPARIVEAVALHHEPEKVDYDGVCAVTAVHVADALVGMLDDAQGDGPRSQLACEMSLTYLRRLGLEPRLAEWKNIALEIANRSEERQPVTS